MDANLNRGFTRMDPPSPADARARQHKEKADPRSGSGDCSGGLLVCPNLTVLSKRQMWVASTRSRHPSVVGDRVLRPSQTCGFDVIDRFKGCNKASWTVAATELPQRMRGRGRRPREDFGELSPAATKN